MTAPLGARGEGSGWPARAQPWWRPHAITVVAVVVSLALTITLALVADSLYNSSAQRLLTLRAHDVGAALTTAVPEIENELNSGLAAAEVTQGNPAAFRTVMHRYVGPHELFVSASLWTLDPQPAMMVRLGVKPDLSSHPTEAAQTFERAASRTPVMDVVGLLHNSSPRVGYAYVGRANAASPLFVAYAETALPANRRVQPSGVFSDLNFALYLGKDTNRHELLATTVARLPLSSAAPVANDVIALGNTSLTLVVAPRGGAIDGAFFSDLPWIVLGVGLFLTAVAAFTSEYLARRRDSAELLALRLDEVAAENELLYREQRGIADTLQRALLPQRLPELESVELAARYLAGADGVDVGGDWYDVMPLNGARFAFAIGDVSGRGVRAASIMASLRFALRAYVLEGHPPATVLDKVAPLLDVESDEHFATVLVGLADTTEHSLELSNAGHLQPILVADGHASVLATPQAPPIGVAGPAHTSVRVAVPAGATLLAFTDGLVERRGSDLDAGYQRVRALAEASELGPNLLLDRLVGELTSEEARDDTALLAIRWRA